MAEVRVTNPETGGQKGTKPERLDRVLLARTRRLADSVISLSRSSANLLMINDPKGMEWKPGMRR